jgi:transposase
MKRPYTPWSNQENKALARMKAEGKSYREIAVALGRSYEAVYNRIAAERRDFVRPAKRSGPFPQITISRSQLCVHYARGWRVAGFRGDRVVLEWPHGKGA